MPDGVLISKVSVEPRRVLVGESVLVDVCGPTGAPYANEERDVSITIDGVPGSQKYMVFSAPGTRRVCVMATAPGREPELRVEEIEVVANKAAPARDVAMLRARRPRAGAVRVVFGGERAAALEAGDDAPDGDSAVEYRWDFGDGRAEVTRAPDVAHDYLEQLSSERPHESYHLTLQTFRGDREERSVRRTVTVTNPFFILRQRGVLMPRVVGEPDLRRQPDGWRVRYVLRNPEAVSLTLEARVVEPMLDAGRAAAVNLATTAVTLDAGDTVTLTASVASAALPKGATGFAIHHRGRSADGLQVRCSAYFDLPDRAGDTVDDDVERALTGAAGSRSKLSLLAASELLRGPSGLTATLRGRAAARRDGAGGAAGVAGTVCDPDNPPAVEPAGMACQLTSEARWTTVPGRFINARKRDIVLNPANLSDPDDLITNLMRQVTPPQRWSHSGIMTRNYDQITHSTASMKRVLDHPNGAVMGKPAPTNGHDPDVLRYLWPGVVTQSAEDSVEGEMMKSPDPGGKRYEIHGFRTVSTYDDGALEVSVPLVVKPDPFLETSAIRAKLERVADFAAAQAGRSYYSFFAYTDPRVRDGAGAIKRAPTSAGWAAGLYPTVCSSLIWYAAKECGVKLEGSGAAVSTGDLEPADLLTKAAVRAGTPDGLYLYTSAERRAAALWLHAKLKDMVMTSLRQQAELLAVLVNAGADMADDVANQMVNTFESGWADTPSKDSDRWKEAKDADAVSPDDILWWDGPDRGGLYGYFEPLRYEPPSYRKVPVYRWRRVAGSGTIEGRVLKGTTPVAGAMVRVSSDKFATSGDDGGFRIANVAAGRYLLTALSTRDGSNWSGEQQVEVAAGGTATATVRLRPPPEENRRVTVKGSMWTRDSQGAGPLLRKEHTLKIHRELQLAPGAASREERFFLSDKVGKTRGEIHVHVYLQADLRVTFVAMAKLFEGWTADTNKEKGRDAVTIEVEKDDTKKTRKLQVHNDEAIGAGDMVTVELTVENERY